MPKMSGLILGFLEKLNFQALLESLDLLLEHAGTEIARPKLGWSLRDVKGNERLLQAWKQKESTRKTWTCCCMVTQSGDEGDGKG